MNIDQFRKMVNITLLHQVALGPFCGYIQGEVGP
jgi:hypothetical protein